jgi:hypothetical protein
MLRKFHHTTFQAFTPVQLSSPFFWDIACPFPVFTGHFILEDVTSTLSQNISTNHPVTYHNNILEEHVTQMLSCFLMTATRFHVYRADRPTSFNMAQHS